MKKNKTVSKEIVLAIIDEYKIAPTDAEDILKSFLPVVEKLKPLTREFEDFFKFKEIDKKVCAEAKKLRNRFGKVRSFGDSAHKKAKKQVLLRSRAIDGARNVLKLQIVEREEKLRDVEKHFERLEEERKRKLNEQRLGMLEKEGLAEGLYDIDFGSMQEAVWVAFLKGQLAEREAEQEAERQAEKERIKQEKIQKLNEKRKDELLDYVEYIADRSILRELGALTENKYKRLKEELETLKIEDEKKWEEEKKQLAKIKKENERLKIEREERKREEEEQRQVEKEREDAEEGKRFEEEEQRRNKKYIDWLRKNKVSIKDVEELDDILVRQHGTRFRMYKFISELDLTPNENEK